MYEVMLVLVGMLIFILIEHIMKKYFPYCPYDILHN